MMAIDLPPFLVVDLQTIVEEDQAEVMDVVIIYVLFAIELIMQLRHVFSNMVFRPDTSQKAEVMLLLQMLLLA
jgi:hypothetical protein